MPKNLVLLSYGSVYEYRRAIFCLQSFSAWTPDISDIRIIVYTDNINFFRDHLLNIRIDFVLLTHALETKFLMNTEYIHLKKVGVVDLTFKNYPNESLCFIDTDTFFIKNPTFIFENFQSGRSYLHKKEYKLSEAVNVFSVFGEEHFPKAFMDFISKRNFEIDGKSMAFDGNDYSWNTGLIALNSDFSKYMNDVVSLTIEFYNASKWFISEQLAFALMMQKLTEISSGEEFLFHYWGKRQKAFVDNFLSSSLDDNNPSFPKNKLAFRKLTKQLAMDISGDIILEQVSIAFNQKSYLSAFKNSLKFFIKNPLSFKTFFRAF